MAKLFKWKLERIKSTVQFHSLFPSNIPWYWKKSKKGVKTKILKSSTSNEIWLLKLFVEWFHYYLIFFWSDLQMNSYRTTGRMKRYLPLTVQTSLQFFELFLRLKLVGLGNLKQMLLGSFLKKIYLKKEIKFHAQ
jgi:hypothetical protein